MLNTIYRLVEPRRFETQFGEFNISEDYVVVRPSFLSICDADIRYYTGSRPAEIMLKKLPLALIHEGVGKVVSDLRNEFQPGERVAMIPNTPHEQESEIAENYMRSSRFRSSDIDGFMQDIIFMNRDRLIPIPEGIDSEVAAFTELTSVCCHAVKRFCAAANKKRRRIGIWGDGNVAYIIALVLKYTMPGAELCIIGKHRRKLEMFSFADRSFNTGQIPEDYFVDHAFECVGGSSSSDAINQIIDHIEPEGTISLLGVSESLIPVKTRMVLEKGLSIIGNSRSGKADFESVCKLYAENPEMVQYLACIINDVVTVRDINDLYTAFEADIHKAFGKTIMRWEI